MTTYIRSINDTTYNKVKNNLINAAQKLLEVRKGDLVFVDFDQLIKSGRDTNVQGKARPAIIISNDKNNRYSPTVWVATLTSNLNKNKLPTHVRVTEDTGLRFDSLALVESVTTIDKSLITKLIGRCSPEIMEQIDTAIKIQAGILNPDYVNELVKSIREIDEFAEKYKYDAEDMQTRKMLVNELKNYCQQYNLNYEDFIINQYKKLDIMIS
jgi:mRNA interferase MazF